MRAAGLTHDIESQTESGQNCIVQCVYEAVWHWAESNLAEFHSKLAINSDHAAAVSAAVSEILLGLDKLKSTKPQGWPNAFMSVLLLDPILCRAIDRREQGAISPKVYECACSFFDEQMNQFGLSVLLLLRAKKLLSETTSTRPSWQREIHTVVDLCDRFEGRKDPKVSGAPIDACFDACACACRSTTLFVILINCASFIICSVESDRFAFSQKGTAVWSLFRSNEVGVRVPLALLNVLVLGRDPIVAHGHALARGAIRHEL